MFSREQLLAGITRMTVVSIGTSSTRLLRGDANRIAVTFIAPPTERYTLAFDATAVLDQGLTIYPTLGPQTFHLWDQAKAVIGEWNAITSGAGAQNVTVIETLLIH